MKQSIRIKMRRITPFLKMFDRVVCIMLLCSATLAVASPAGLWRFTDDNSIIEFVPCQTAWCGVVRALPPKMKEDKKGCGFILIGDLKSVSPTVWGEGWVIDPKDDKRYSAALHFSGTRAELVISAYGGLFTERLKLVRQAADFKPCS
jgi:uncharacterized protein (DUF2147 family)